MKVLQIISAFYPPYGGGGAAHVAHNISEALAKRGHEVTVYTTNALSRDRLFYPKQNPNCRNGVKIYYYANMVYKPSFHIYFSKELVEAIKKSISEYDLVHLHEYRSYISLVVSHYAKKYRVPYILQAHGQLPRIASKRKLKRIYDVFFGYRLLRDASKVIALSPIEAKQFMRMGVPKKKVVIVPNGIDVSEYAILPPNGRFKEKYGIEKGKKIVLFLGRLNRFKGIDFLINSFTYMIKNVKYEDAILVIAGPDDGYLNEIKKLVQQYKIENRILFTGPLFGERKIETYVDASVVASLDSLEEVVFLLVPLEAAACGVPIIVTKSNYIASLTKQGKFGFSVDYGKVTALSNLLVKILRNEDLIEELGRNGRQYVFKMFDWNRIIGKLEQLYQNVIGQ